MKLDKTMRAYGAELLKRYREKAGKPASTTPAGTIAVRGSARAPRAIGALRPAATKTEIVSAKDLTPELEAEFRRGGLSAESARVAARGRGVGPQPSTLVEAFKARGLSEKAAAIAARGRERRS